MTNNQMVSFPRELGDELGELIAEKARVCGGGAFDIWEAICDQFGTPAAQPQGEPVTIQAVAVTRDNGEEGLRLEWLLEGGISEMEFPGMVLFAIPEANDLCDEDGSAEVYREQPAPVAVVPEGYCIMPRQLTAENGAKSLLLGEFKLQVTKECPECCELEEPTEGCSICDGEGEYEQKHTIPWDQIKFIYSKAVAGMALKAESAKSR